MNYFEQNKPLITVYVTNHNYGHFIKQCIDSILSQTLQDFRLIIIDDGSTDNSREIIDEYKNRDNIDIIYQLRKCFAKFPIHFTLVTLVRVIKMLI